jgi:hypothetical protein
MPNNAADSTEPPRSTAWQTASPVQARQWDRGVAVLRTRDENGHVRRKDPVTSSNYAPRSAESSG